MSECLVKRGVGANGELGHINGKKKNVGLDADGVPESNVRKKYGARTWEKCLVSSSNEDEERERREKRRHTNAK